MEANHDAIVKLPPDLRDDPDTLVKDSGDLHSVQGPTTLLCQQCWHYVITPKYCKQHRELVWLTRRKKKKMWPTFQEPVQLSITGLQIKWGLMFREICLVHTVLSHSTNFKTQPSDQMWKDTESVKVKGGRAPGSDCCEQKERKKKKTETRPGLGHGDSWQPQCNSTQAW